MISYKFLIAGTIITAISNLLPFMFKEHIVEQKGIFERTLSDIGKPPKLTLFGEVLTVASLIGILLLLAGIIMFLYSKMKSAESSK